MKIGNTPTGIPEQAPASPAGNARAAADEPAKATAERSATVELSSTAASLLTGTKGVAAEFDAAKVARISQAISDGSFEVNAEAIADKLIANAEEVLGNVKR